MTFYNISNHPAHPTEKNPGWSKEQMDAAKALSDEVVDIPFPVVDPRGDRQYIHRIALEVCLPLKEGDIAHVMGEMGVTTHCVGILNARGILTVHSTTERVLSSTGAPVFKFVQFRRY